MEEAEIHTSAWYPLCIEGAQSIVERIKWPRPLSRLPMAFPQQRARLGRHQSNCVQSTTLPSCVPEAFINAYHWLLNQGVLGPDLRRPCTEPSQKAN